MVICFYTYEYTRHLLKINNITNRYSYVADSVSKRKCCYFQCLIKILNVYSTPKFFIFNLIFHKNFHLFTLSDNVVIVNFRIMFHS